MVYLTRVSGPGCPRRSRSHQENRLDHRKWEAS